MKTRKRILATLLSVAVAATTVLPGGALTANAATIVTTTSETEVETAEWSETMERINSGGELYWHIQSSTSDHNSNAYNDDYMADNAPMVVLDMDRDMTYKGEDFSVSTEIYPNGTSSKMRFGIMVKYVDSTHWAYLNYDTNRWLLEYKCDDLGGYPKISALEGKTLTDYKDTNVTVTYKESSMDVKITPVGEEEVVATLQNEEEYDGVLAALETYAADNDLPIRYGFKAGTFGSERTDVNLKNMTYKGRSMMNDVWEPVKEREGQVLDKNDPIGGKNYSIVDAKAAEKTVSYLGLTGMESGTVSAVLRSATDGGKFALAAKQTDAGSVKVGYDGSKWYYTVGANKTTTNTAVTVEKDKDYQINMTIADGKLSAGVVPVDAGTEEAPATEVAIVSDVNVSSVAAGTIAVAAEAGTELWVRNVNYEKRSYAESTELNNRYDEVAQAANLSGNNADNKYFTAAWATFKTAADDAKAKIDADEITSDEATSALNTLNSEYTKLQNNEVQKSKPFTDLVAELEKVKDIAQITPEGTYSQATWDEFVAKKAAAQKIVDEIATTPYENSAAITRTNALRDLKAATNALALLANDSEKAALQAALAAANALNASHYEEDGWNDFVLARDDAAAVFANIANATKDDITDVLAALTRAQEDLVLKAASADEVAASTNEIAAIESAVNGKFTVDAAYTQALQTVKDLLKKENVTKKEIDEAMAALNAAKAALKPVETQVQTPPAATLTKGQTQKVGKMTYKVLDPAKKTVSLTKGQDKKNVTVPDTVKIGSETCKVVTIGKNAFKGSKKLTSVIIGKNVTKIEGSAFANSKKLKQVTFKGTSVKTIAGKAFTKIASKVTVKVPKKLKKDSKFKNKLKKAGMKQITIK